MIGRIKHLFQSAKADGADATLVRPSSWNETHFAEALGMPPSSVEEVEDPFFVAPQGVGIDVWDQASAPVGGLGINRLLVPASSLVVSGRTATVRQVPYGFIGARAQRTTDQTGVVNNTDTRIAYNATDIWDTDGFHDPATNNTRMTIPAGLGGKYLITASAVWDTTATGHRHIWMAKNGATVTGNIIRDAGTNSYLSQTYTEIMDLVAGDYIEVNVRQDSGSDRTLGFGSLGSSGFFTIVKLDAGRVGSGIGASAYAGATTSVTTSTFTSIAMNTEFFDTDGFHSTSSNTERMTIPAGMAGKYLVTANSEWDGNTTGERILRILKNGSGEFAWVRMPASTGTTTTSQNATAIIDLAVGDYVTADVYQTSGGTRTVGGNARTSISIMRLDTVGATIGGDASARFYHFDDGISASVGTWAYVATTTALLYGSQLWGNSSTAQNDAMTWTRFLQAGTYTIQIRGVRNADKPIVTVKVDGVSVGTVEYYGALAYLRTSIAGVVIATGGSHTIEVVMATKNASSTGYGMAFSDVMLYRTA